MDLTNAILNYRRFIKRKNYSTYTVKNYMSTLRQFILWIDIPVESVSNKKLLSYIDHLQRRCLAPKTINSHLDSIRGFYNYLIDEEQVQMANPVKRGYALRLSRPLPRYLMDEDVARLFSVIENRRDRAIFMLMLRCGLRVEEVAKLTLAANFKRSQLFVFEGKGGKGRVVYLSRDAQSMLEEYLRNRPPSRSKRVFLKRRPIAANRSRFGAFRSEWSRGKGRHKSLVSSASSYDGHAVTQCGCGPCIHTGFIGSHTDKDDAEICQGIQCKGSARLSQGDRKSDRTTKLTFNRRRSSDELKKDPFSSRRHCAGGEKT